MKATLSLAAVVVAGAVALAGPPEPKLNSAAGKGFAAKVQPILANACADCHARKDHTSPFKLKATDPAYHDPQAADANLRAVTSQLDFANPHASPLLKYATTAHGKPTDPPMKAGSPAARNLELWVHWACGLDGSAMPTAVPPPPAKDSAVLQAGAKEPAPKPMPTEPAKLPPLKATPIQPFAEPKKTDAPKPNPADPFDPAGFNKK